MPKSQNKQLNSNQWPIIGHSKIVSYLQHCLITSQLSHAYLFHGPAQLGKTTVASLLVDGLVDSGANHSNQTNELRFHPDIHWVGRQVNDKTGQLRKNISIDQIRELQSKLSLHSFLNTKKVSVITEAQTLSTEAANSLLKTLEEPTPNTVLILVAENISSLPQTIVSRCQVLKFLPVSSQEIFDHLLTLKVERKKAQHITQLSFGRPGVALNFAHHQEAYSESLLAGRNFMFLLKASLVERFKAVDELVKNSETEALYQTLEQWQSWLRDLLLISYLPSSFMAHASLHSDLEKMSERYGDGKVLKMFSQLEQTKTYLKANVNPKLAFENLILNF